MRKNIVIAGTVTEDSVETMVSDIRDSLAPAELVQRRLNELAGEVPTRTHPNAAVAGRRPERTGRR